MILINLRLSGLQDGLLNNVKGPQELDGGRMSSLQMTLNLIPQEKGGSQWIGRIS